MGTLTKYSLSRVPCNIFVETGTGSGTSLMHALKSKRFKQLFSVEIHKESAERAVRLFENHPEVKIFNSDSESALIEVFKQVHPADRLFFFLDAHFPGEFSEQFDGYAGSAADRVTLPLEHELALINKHRQNSSDVIVVDDLRLYEEGPFERGNLPSGVCQHPKRDEESGFLAPNFPAAAFHARLPRRRLLIHIARWGRFRI